MKICALLLAVVCGLTQAQTSTTPNLVNMNSWSGVDYPNPAVFSLCCTGGPNAAMNTSTNTLRFSWGPGIASQTWAINNVLSGQGIKVSGYNYSWAVDNSGSTAGLLNANVSFYKNNNVVESYNYSYGTTAGLTQFSGTETFNKPYATNSLTSATLTFTGQDNQGSVGYWGPRVRNPSLSLNYTASGSTPASPATTQSAVTSSVSVTLNDPAPKTAVSNKTKTTPQISVPDNSSSDNNTLSLGLSMIAGAQSLQQSMDPANPLSTRSLSNMLNSANKDKDNEEDREARKIAGKSTATAGVDLGTGASLTAMAAVPPGYGSYSVQIITQVPFYSPREVYRNQRVVDNDRLRRGLSSRSDLLHQNMIDAQYLKGN